MVESITLSIDYVPVKKYDDMKKLCTKRYERITELEAKITRIKQRNKDLVTENKLLRISINIHQRKLEQALKGGDA